MGAEGSMTPDSSRHSSSMILQMETAIPIQVLMRLQIIIQLRPNPNIGLFFEKLPEVFLPVLWFDAEAAIDEEMASQVNMLAMMPTAGLVFGGLSLAGAALCLLLFFVDMRSKTLRAPTVEVSEI